MNVDLGIFRLIDPPPGQEEVIRRAIDAIDYPWERFAVPLARDSDHAIVVEWDDTGGQVSGLAYGYSLRIVLGTRAYHLDEGAGFVFAHEVGHLVDAATLRDEDRAAITALYHQGDFIQMGHFNHDHVDAGHVSEGWKDNANAYVSRLNECYADQFVAAFAPDIWSGAAGLGGARPPRFVHWTEDHQAIRDLTLWEPEVPEVEEDGMVTFRQIKDVGRRHPRARYIRRAVNLGLMDLNREGRFFPGRRVTRAQVAEMLVKLHDKEER